MGEMKRGYELDKYKPAEALSESNMTEYKEIVKIQPKIEGVHQQYKSMKAQFLSYIFKYQRSMNAYICSL